MNRKIKEVKPVELIKQNVRGGTQWIVQEDLLLESRTVKKGTILLKHNDRLDNKLPANVFLMFNKELLRPEYVIVPDWMIQMKMLKKDLKKK